MTAAKLLLTVCSLCRSEKHLEQTRIHKNTRKKGKHAEENVPPQTISPSTLSELPASRTRPWLEATASSCSPGNRGAKETSEENKIIHLNSLISLKLHKRRGGGRSFAMPSHACLQDMNVEPIGTIRTVYGPAKQRRRTVHVCILTNQGRGNIPEGDMDDMYSCWSAGVSLSPHCCVPLVARLTHTDHISSAVGVEINVIVLGGVLELLMWSSSSRCILGYCYTITVTSWSRLRQKMVTGAVVSVS